MLVEMPVGWRSPWIVLVRRENDVTDPARPRLGGVSGIMSTKLVSTRLKPVVCELAMLPEMFSSE
jgi:ADP-dependent phosphofructokinase/glucokinase